MRHIPLRKNKPDQAWLDKAANLLESLRLAANAEARNKIIDDNQDVWGELKEWLLSISHGKCWFSEAKDCFSHFDVEHYRPKKSAKDADGTVHEGYWYHAFNWENLRICGNVGNRKKGTFFPLRAGSNRVPPGGDLRLEDPYLLDPADEDDPNLLSFDFEGHAVPAPGSNKWEKERVEYSVQRCKLDFTVAKYATSVVIRVRFPRLWISERRFGVSAGAEFKNSYKNSVCMMRAAERTWWPELNRKRKLMRSGK